MLCYQYCITYSQVDMHQKCGREAIWRKRQAGILELGLGDVLRLPACLLNLWSGSEVQQIGCILVCQ